MMRMRRAVPAMLLLAVLLALGGCGEDDVQQVARDNPIKGYGFPYGPSATGSAFTADYLQAYPVTVPVSTNVVGFAIWISNLSGQTSVKLALYRDSASLPGQLVTASEAHPLRLGRNPIPAPYAPITPGTYWLVKRLSRNAGVYTVSGGSGPRLWQNYPFGNPWPNPMVALNNATSAPANLVVLTMD